jgi:DNA-binding MarR family transcriptional regulator
VLGPLARDRQRFMLLDEDYEALGVSRRIDQVSMSPPPAGPSFTPKQGQYLAFIYAYTRVLGRPPAEADLQRHFGVSPPSVHQMVLTLERAGLIRRQPGIARSIEVLIAPEFLPILR